MFHHLLGDHLQLRILDLHDQDARNSISKILLRSSTINNLMANN